MMRNFNPDNLLAAAASRTVLDDFGDDKFREGLERLVDDLPAASLTADGKVAAEEMIIGKLAARLKAIAGFKAHPQAMARPIVRPLVITGIVRSGTTALHNLLSMDPQFQGPELWLCEAPQPRPPRASWTGNTDFAAAKVALDQMIAVAPELLDDHGMAVDTVEESLPILAQNFCSNMFPSQLDIPAYDAWYRGQEDIRSYAHLADVLRLIGAHEPHRRWLIKNPTDTFSMRELINVFPDAMIVQTHRDPLQAIPSICNLLAGAHRIFRGESTDMAKVYAREQEMWALAMERAEAVKTGIPGQVIDIRFSDFVRDQMAAVERIYDHFGLTLSAQTESDMRQWLIDHPRRSTTMQRFTPEHFGGRSPALLERFAGYRQKYGYAV
jgi:hypothetical protein